MKKRLLSMMVVALAVLMLVAGAAPALAQGDSEDTAGVQETRRALAIDAPDRAPVGEEVTMTVYQRGTADPVKDAGVWALTREQAEELRAEVDSIREQDAESLRDLDWESVVGIRGTFLDATNGSGQLKHSFGEAGGYLLVALKPGYYPGWKGIYIIAPRVESDGTNSSGGASTGTPTDEAAD